MHALSHSVPPILQQATANPHLCQPTPPLATHGHSQEVWVSLLWGHCSFLRGPGGHMVLFVPSKSLFPQSCVSSGSSMVGQPPPKGLMPCPGLLYPEPLPLQQSTADPYLSRIYSDTILSQSLCVLWVLVCPRFV